MRDWLVWNMISIFLQAIDNTSFSFSVKKLQSTKIWYQTNPESWRFNYLMVETKF